METDYAGNLIIDLAVQSELSWTQNKIDRQMSKQKGDFFGEYFKRNANTRLNLKNHVLGLWPLSGFSGFQVRRKNVIKPIEWVFYRMVTRTKRILKRIIFLFSAVFVIVPITKNLILYFTYEHDNNSYERTMGTPGKIEGEWRGTFDTFYCGLDERHIFVFKISSDSIGELRYLFCGEKIGGINANAFSYESLLPFDKAKARSYTHPLVIEKDFFQILPATGGMWKDTAYAKYDFRNDSLFIDSRMKDERYSGEPVWKLAFSEKNYSLIDCFKLW